MNKNNILLSICIPTYNRVEILKAQLERIDKDINNLDICRSIEIHISDNNSSDSTLELCRQYAQMDLPYKFKYRTNEKNIGPSKNFMEALLGATGEYVWMMSDDDVIHEGSIEYLYKKIIENTEAGYIFINYFSRKNQILPAIPPQTKDHITYSFDQFLNETLLFYSLVSASCFRRSLLCREKLENRISRGIYSAKDDDKTVNFSTGNYYPQLYWVSDIVTFHPSLIIGKPLFTMHHPGVEYTRTLPYPLSGIREPFDPYLMAHLDAIEFHSHIMNYELTTNTKIKVFRFLANENLNQIIFHKITSQKYDIKAIRTAIPVMIRKFYLNPFLWFLHLPVLILPSFVAKIMWPLRFSYYFTVRAKLGALIRNLLVR